MDFQYDQDLTAGSTTGFQSTWGKRSASAGFFGVVSRMWGDLGSGTDCPRLHGVGNKSIHILPRMLQPPLIWGSRMSDGWQHIPGPDRPHRYVRKIRFLKIFIAASSHIVESLLSGLSSSGSVWPVADLLYFRKTAIRAAGSLRNLPEGQGEQVDLNCCSIIFFW